MYYNQGADFSGVIRENKKAKIGTYSGASKQNLGLNEDAKMSEFGTYEGFIHKFGSYSGKIKKI